jgi:hypothetical protein
MNQKATKVISSQKPRFLCPTPPPCVVIVLKCGKIALVVCAFLMTRIETIGKL